MSTKAAIRFRSLAEDYYSIGVLCVGVSVLSLLLGGRSPLLNSTLIGTLINLILVVGLYVFVGNSGIVSFGQVSFMAVGAYVCGMFTIPLIAKKVIIPNAPSIFQTTVLGTTVAVIIAGLVAAVFAAICSVPLMRLSGIGASIGTLALLLIVNTFFANWKPGTSGGGNLTRIPTDLTVGYVLVWALLALLVAFFYQRTRFGLRLRAAREDEVAARAVGVNVRGERRIAFTISGLMFGVGGALYGHSVGSFSAADFFLPITFLTLAMLVVGGMLSITGAVVGTVLLSLVAFVFNQWQNGNAIFGLLINVPDGIRDLVVASVLIVVLLLRPDGLTKGRDLWLPRALRRETRASEPAAIETTQASDATR